MYTFNDLSGEVMKLTNKFMDMFSPKEIKHLPYDNGYLFELTNEGVTSTVRIQLHPTRIILEMRNSKTKSQTAIYLDEQYVGEFDHLARLAGLVPVLVDGYNKSPKGNSVDWHENNWDETMKAVELPKFIQDVFFSFVNAEM